MNFKIDNQSKNNLSELKSNIEKFLSIDFENLEVNDENSMKVKEIILKINRIASLEFRFGRLKINIVSSDGTELTTI